MNQCRICNGLIQPDQKSLWHLDGCAHGCEGDCIQSLREDRSNLCDLLARILGSDETRLDADLYEEVERTLKSWPWLDKEAAKGGQ